MATILSGFSPRNGEVILKFWPYSLAKEIVRFQSPQWGSNSKVEDLAMEFDKYMCFSPRNGEVILKLLLFVALAKEECFSPRNGEVILK